MTHEEFYSDKLTDAQRKAILDLHYHQDSDLLWEHFLEKAFLPTVLNPYVGINVNGMFLGVEPDGYTHA